MPYRILIVFLFFFKSPTFAQPIFKQNWQASWIAAASHTEPNTFWKFRKSISLGDLPKKAILSIATDSKYWLYINEKLVVFEGQLKRGPTPNDTYYDEVDIAPFLKKGENHFAILVWYWGKDGFSHKSSGKCGLLFQAELDNKTYISDATFKVAQHLSFQNGLAPLPNFRLPEHNIHYDARLDNEDWLKNNFNFSNWSNANVIAHANEAPFNKLWLRPIPQWHNSGLTAYKNNFTNGLNTYTMQLGNNLAVTPYFKIDAPAGCTIQVKSDNYFGGGDANIRTTYITKQGVQEFETPAYINGHNIIYDFPPQVKVLDLMYRETKYNTKHVGAFNCNDSFLNTLFIKSLNTLNINMRDGIYDSPDRERAQWWGDIVIVLEEIFYSCDSNGKAAIKKAISNLLEWQKPNGVLFSPIPAGNWAKELPAQMLAAISKYGIWHYVLHSGDTATIAYAYPFVKKYISLYNLNKYGLVNHRAGDWDWHDWGNKIDEPVLDNAWYYMALDACYNMAKHLNLSRDADDYNTQMHTLKNSFQNNFWNGKCFASKNYKFFADDRANGLAVCAGLVTDKQWQSIKPILDTTFYAGPYLEKYILEAYFKMNSATDAIKRLKLRYSSMVENESIATLWEGWEIGSATYGGGTYNHGWTGGPLSLMSAYIAGIKPTEIGYASYSIKPQLALLNVINATVNTAKGVIKMELLKNINSLKINLQTIAANGTIAIPKIKNHYKKVYINGKLKHNNFKFISEDMAYYYFKCTQAGSWVIDCN